MHEDDRLLLSKKQQEELRLSKAAKPYDREDVEELLAEFKAIESINEDQQQDIDRATAWIEYCLGLSQFGLVPSWDGLVGQIGLCRGRWTQWKNYGSYETPTFFVVRRIESEPDAD